MVESDKVLPLVSKLLQPFSWNPINFGDEGKEEMLSITWTQIHTVGLAFPQIPYVYA